MTARQQAKGKRNRGGFTLIELMTVVAVIGVLATVAAPEMIKYLRKSKTIEAIAAIAKISAGARVYYDAHRRLPCTMPMDSDQTCAADVPLTPSVTHAEACSGYGGFMPPGSESQFNDSIWPLFLYQPDGNARYRYSFEAVTTKTSAHGEIRAVGDLDCDGDYSIWVSHIKTDPTSRQLVVQSSPNCITSPLE